MSNDYLITDRSVMGILNRIDELASEMDLKYMLVGGMASQSYSVDGLMEKTGKPLNEIHPNALDRYLRRTEDIDLAFVTDRPSDLDIFMNNLTNPFSGGYNGAWKGKTGTGLIKLNKGSIFLNANQNVATGISNDVYNEMINNRNEFTLGDTNVYRIKLEDLMWTKLEGYTKSRKKDLRDIESLLKLNGDNIDNDYLYSRIGENEDLKVLYENCKKRYVA